MNLNIEDQNALRSIVSRIRSGELSSEFLLIWHPNGPRVFAKTWEFKGISGVTKAAINELKANELIAERPAGDGGVFIYVKAEGYSAVDADFIIPEKPNLDRIRLYFMAASFAVSVILFFLKDCN